MCRDTWIKRQCRASFAAVKLQQSGEDTCKLDGQGDSEWYSSMLVWSELPGRRVACQAAHEASVSPGRPEQPVSAALPASCKAAACLRHSWMHAWLLAVLPQAHQGRLPPWCQL